MTTSNNIENLQLYANFIEKLANEQNTLHFDNSGSQHASIVMANIFRTSKNTVRIYSGAMNPRVTNDENYLKQLELFLNRNGKVKLMLEYERNDESKAFKMLKEWELWKGKEGQVKIVEKKGKLFFLDKQMDKPIHFATGDNNSFRVEINTEKHLAKCCFNNEEAVKELNSKFDSKI